MPLDDPVVVAARREAQDEARLVRVSGRVKGRGRPRPRVRARVGLGLG